MAKQSKIAAQRRREEVVARYAARRAELKEAQRTAASPEEASRVAAELQRLPRDASPTRLRNRDAVDGRPRGVRPCDRPVAGALPRRGPRRAPAGDHEVELVTELPSRRPRTASSGNVG